MKKFVCSFVFFILIFCCRVIAEEKVLEFSAKGRSESIFLSWETTPHSSHLLLYRSVKPFTKSSSLIDGVLLSIFSNDTKEFIDTLPESSNYYALIFLDEIISGGEIEFIPGKNSILSPVKIDMEFADAQTTDYKRTLPLLNIEKTPAVVFSAETESKIDKLENRFRKYSYYLAELKTAENINFFRFENATALTTDLNSLSLKRILDINEKNWIELEKDLKRFLELSHSDDITLIAYFYLGEAYFFQSKFAQTLLTFLQVENYFEKEAKT